MTIKHMVISGGGPSGLVAYGVIKQLALQKVLDIFSLETIYTSSVGSIFGVVVTLGYDWEWLDDYFIKRPWNKILEIDPTILMNSFTDKGIYGLEIYQKLLEPLLTAKNLSSTITLQEYYEYNNIELHIFTSDLNKDIPLSIDMSYKTHPDLPLVKAIYMSASFPFLFKPLCENGSCFIDGGLLNNYPMQNCIDNIKKKNKINENNKSEEDCVNYDEIIGLKKITSTNISTICNDTNVLEYGVEMYRKMHQAILKDTESKTNDIKNTIECVVRNESGFESWWNIFSTEKGRKEVISDGESIAKEFIEKHLKTA